MELYDAMRTTFAAREFTGEPLPDGILYRILDNARVAPSGGKRQGARLLVVRAPHTRKTRADLALPGARRYIAQIKAGENPWNSVEPCGVDTATIAHTEVPPSMTRPLLDARSQLRGRCASEASAIATASSSFFSVPSPNPSNSRMIVPFASISTECGMASTS